MNFFKKITGAFSGKSKAPDETQSAPSQAMITVYDKLGRQMLVSREEWRKNVLPRSLREKYDDPEGLYDTIVVSLNDGFFNEVRDASKRLLQIDPNKERSFTVRAIVLMKTDDLDGAESILSQYIKDHGPTGMILTNLAKVYSARGDHSQAEKTLWQGLTMDPNQSNGLDWFGAIYRDRAGHEGFLDAIRKASAIPGSYRPQLWLARSHLDSKDINSAKQIYLQILKDHADAPDVLMMISGDLGQHGYVQEMLELVTPIYQPEKHDLGAGLNLLSAYVQLKDDVAGNRLLHQLAMLGRHDFKQHLAHFETEFANIKKQRASVDLDGMETPALESVLFDRPIWYYSLNNPTWLFSEEPSGLSPVLFLSLSNLSGAKTQQIQPEDDLGRLTRSIPFYLAESVLYETALSAKVVIPTVRGSGPAVFGTELSSDWIWQFAGQQGGADFRFIVTGTIAKTDTGVNVTLCLWDWRARQLVTRIERASSEAGNAVRLAEQDLLSSLRSTVGQPAIRAKAILPERPTSCNLDRYLSALGQSLMMTFVVNEFVPKNLWGERNMLDWFLFLAAEGPSPIPRIMFLSGLAKCKAYGSDVYQEYRSQAMAFIDEAKDGNVLHRLSPFVYRLFGMEDLFACRRNALKKNADKAYSEWVDRL
jgi:tetratricopeptide (TPR) repeat protein